MRKFERDDQNRIVCDDDPGKWLDHATDYPRDFGYFGDDKDTMFHTWALGPVIEHRDSGLCDRSNAAALRKFLESDPSLENEYRITECGHWAVGHVDHLSFHAFETEEGREPTRIARILAAWFTYLHDVYPLADEDLHSQMEWDASMKWIDEEGQRVARRLGYELPDDWHGLVCDWWDANDSSALESTDDNGASPSEDQFREAFDGCGFKREEDEATT